MGPIVDRSRERLGTSDTAIIAMRRLLLEESRALSEGREPATPHHPGLTKGPGRSGRARLWPSA